MDLFISLNYSLITNYLIYTSLLGNDIPVLPVTTCTTWYTWQSLNN